VNKFLSFLGLTRKSGKLLLGYNKNEEAIKLRQLFLVIISTGAAENTKKKFQGLAERAGVPLIEDYTTEELGMALGRKEIAVVGVIDRSMAAKLISIREPGDVDG
jgi:ribosomal protein L7Ae-like RNA K-turn-binding protein